MSRGVFVQQQGIRGRQVHPLQADAHDDGYGLEKVPFRDSADMSGEAPGDLGDARIPPHA